MSFVNGSRAEEMCHFVDAYGSLAGYYPNSTTHS
jgi:hypothetical protein